MSLEKPVKLDKKTHEKLSKLAKKNRQTIGGCASMIIEKYCEASKN